MNYICKKTIEMENEKQIILAQSNALTNSRYDFNVIEKRCLYCIIGQVRRTYVETGNIQDAFKNMRVKIAASSLKELGGQQKEVYNSLRKLRKRDIEIENDDIWVSTSYVTMVKHDKKQDVFEVEVSGEIMPYLVELAGEFTEYDLTVAITLKSTYSQRFYEWCNQWKNRNNKTFFYTTEELRTKMCIEDKYANGADFKKNVLEVARKELKTAFDAGQCELYFDYAPKESYRRKVLSWYFYVHTRDERKISPDVYVKSRTKITSILSSFIKRDKKFISKVLNYIDANPNMSDIVLEKLMKKVEEYDKEYIPGVLRVVLREDFGIK